jgi:uncharacterized protein (TIGR02646 family)
MRPVERGVSPQANDFDNYEDAKPELINRIGPYCSYCERHIVTLLAVEHIQPKDQNRYPQLVGRWDNFLLACVNCNSTKGSKDVILNDTMLPDRDNTFLTYEYTLDGYINLSVGLSQNQKICAETTLRLTGLDKRVSEVLDSNGQLVAIDRVSQRMEAWGIAEESLANLALSPIDPMRRQIVITAKETGHFSIWMKVFEADSTMRRMLIDGFNNTSQNCFDNATTQPINRPAGKI